MALTCTKCGGTIADIGGHIGACNQQPKKATGIDKPVTSSGERIASRKLAKGSSDTNELDEILENLECGVLNLYGDFHEEALSLLFGATTQLVERLITTKEQEARIDELEKLVVVMNAIRVDDGFVPVEYTYIRKRLKELKGDI